LVWRVLFRKWAERCGGRERIRSGLNKYWKREERDRSDERASDTLDTIYPTNTFSSQNLLEKKKLVQHTSLQLTSLHPHPNSPHIITKNPPEREKKRKPHLNPQEKKERKR